MTDDTIHTCSYYCERPECVRRQRDELRDRMEAELASAPPSAPVGVDAVMVPKEPSEGVLVSMAIRYDHGLGVPGYYDQPLFGGENGGHKRRMESTVAKMRQLYEEVVGAGFYSREREEEYAALAQQPAAPSETVNVVGMPEFNGLLDHIYEYGTAAEGVIERANAFARAVIARYTPRQSAVVNEEPTT